jgi:2-dehydro-3-deoxyphosphogluconate aldolase / (4S)-4-hydroxy-2-oxoglutarate aldolase
MSAFSLSVPSPVMPVVTFESAESAVPLAQALLRGGIRAIEVTLRTPIALECIRRIARDVPEILVGAGTVLRPADLDAAAAHGARFALSPGCTAELLAAAQVSTLPFMPGIATASELMLAASFGFNAVKFFPADSSGGVRTLTALSGPFPQAQFCPTGGISPANAKDYLALPQVLCVGGSWITPSRAIASGDWTAIEAAARQAAALKPS